MHRVDRPRPRQPRRPTRASGRSRSWRARPSRRSVTGSRVTCSGGPDRVGPGGCPGRDLVGGHPAPSRRHGAPVVRRDAEGGVRHPAGRRPSGPRLGPGRGHRGRHQDGPPAGARHRRLVRRPRGCLPGRGAISPRLQLAGDAQHDLLARFGRDASWGPNHRVLVRFNAAFGSGDVDAALALVTDDIVFDSTSPGPDGQRHEGREAVRTVWTEVMTTQG